MIEDTDNNNTSNPLEEKDNSVTPEQKLKDEAWINAHKHQFYPTKVLNEETGMIESFLLSYCINCRYPEPSVLNYAEFSPTHGKLIGKVTGRTPCDGKEDFDYWCFMCGFCNANTDYMKKFIEQCKKEKAKQARFPDEYYGSTIHSVEENHPEVEAAIRKLSQSAEGQHLTDGDLVRPTELGLNP